jgi:hypothetical protein
MQIGLPGLLTIIFAIAKLVNYIDWSWWWVFSPLWIGFSIWIVIVGFMAILASK